MRRECGRLRAQDEPGTGSAAVARTEGSPRAARPHSATRTCVGKAGAERKPTPSSGFGSRRAVPCRELPGGDAGGRVGRLAVALHYMALTGPRGIKAVLGVTQPG
jgi:hypothetical protein